MEDLKEALKFFAVLSMIILAVVGLALTISYFTQQKACAELGATTGHATRYAFWPDCQIQLRGEWVPVNNWRVVDGPGHR
jgi:hypothetical protein